MIYYPFSISLCTNFLEILSFSSVLLASLALQTTDKYRDFVNQIDHLHTEIPKVLHRSIPLMAKDT